ncbi:MULTISPECIES: histidinol-phosphate transaminase [unclassified Rhodococcus (in: high G+C Gram-positive bacteria)]|uniref:pyridoxal phosphate-dependent aminotransferase n=1 Tax=unclassified Rhodococcus (in: high G+C Gram-positive bacteria) TaxID=192944 RepID=UPI00163A5D69|nr:MULTISPECIES: aminotransferase class I/II-fold pyridoxal phosphate-dependent enzyme [unclassified Rhodococcus (in: high G+C Gram-positive bacteria)]MBC2641892.1 aminotransferase class I/II-fold pyridoxal phosphate-dependent enzyme [Rhodococcus sp. 3A]
MRRAARLASNESPFPPVDRVAAAIRASITQANRYPDFESRKLTDALASRWHLSPDQVSVDSGSSSLLRNIVTACAGPGTEIVYGRPSFPSYEHAALLAGATPIRVALTPDYRLDLTRILAAINERTRVVLLCLPNNPTGTTVAHSALEAFIEAVPGDLLIVLDECYREFVTDPNAASGFRLLGRFPNVAVVKSLSKSAGLAGLRIGYALSSPDVGLLLRAVRIPFSVSAAAQAAALACLEPAVTTALESRITATVSERNRVFDILTSKGIEVVPSEANFLFLPHQHGAQKKVQLLARHGALVRLVGPREIRITVGSRKENDHLLSCIDALTQ